MSYVRSVKALFDLHQVRISQRGIDEIMKRAGKKAIQASASIQETVRQSKVIHSDETGSRMDGANGQEWVFCTLSAVLHIIRTNRSVDVIKEVMGVSQAEVWVSDCYGGQLKAPTQQRQLCLVHPLDNLRSVVDAYPSLIWPRAMLALFRHAIHIHHQRSQVSPEQFSDQAARVERICDRLLQQSLASHEAHKVYSAVI